MGSRYSIFVGDMTNPLRFALACALSLTAGNVSADVPNPEPDPACAGKVAGTCCDKKGSAGVCLAELGVLVCATELDGADKEKHASCFAPSSSASTGSSGGSTSVGEGQGDGAGQDASPSSSCSYAPSQKSGWAAWWALLAVAALRLRRHRAPVSPVGCSN